PSGGKGLSAGPRSLGGTKPRRSNPQALASTYQSRSRVGCSHCLGIPCHNPEGCITKKTYPKTCLVCPDVCLIRRLVILRKRIQFTEGQLRLADEIRYFFYITNIPREHLGTAAVVRENNARCHQENMIEQLKNEVHATRMPVAEFDANWAYLVIAS